MRSNVFRNENKERYEKLREDTDKLLELANALKTEVDRTDSNTFSVSVIKATEQIEKLAKNIREKMLEDIGPAFK